MRSLRLAVSALVAGLGLAIPQVATADHNANPIHPGVQTVTRGAQCTSNFVFRDGAGTYLGQSAHCAGTGPATETNGCRAETRRLGTRVRIEGAGHRGTMVYSSWIAMQRTDETNRRACRFNDFALVRIHRDDVRKVSPNVPGFGGPTGLAPSSGMVGDTVYTYGNSSLRLGVAQLRPKQGVVIDSRGRDWSRDVYTATPGIPGDSGSGFLSDSGEAMGTLSTVQLAPLAGSNGVSDMRKELKYARAHGFPGLSLVKGSRPFEPDLVGAIIGD